MTLSCPSKETCPFCRGENCATCGEEECQHGWEERHAAIPVHVPAKTEEVGTRYTIHPRAKTVDDVAPELSARNTRDDVFRKPEEIEPEPSVARVPTRPLKMELQIDTINEPDSLADFFEMLGRLIRRRRQVKITIE